MREIAAILHAFERHRGAPLALATLVRAHGSSYRRPGARMLITPDGQTAGSLSGGCLEEEVIERARTVLRTGAPALMSFDTRRRFGCHGTLEILVERVHEDFLTSLADHYRTRRPCQIATSIHTGSRIVNHAPKPSEDDLLQLIEPPLQLLILGDGPDSNALRSIAHSLGWPTHSLEAASELAESYDAWTAAIVKTHNYGRDFAALRTLLAMHLPYIGLMGPRARREQLVGDLFDTGLEPGPNLFAPAGLDLGGGSPETIALAIIAEIQSVIGGGSRQSLRDRRTPIHAQPTVETAAAP